MSSRTGFPIEFRRPATGAVGSIRRNWNGISILSGWGARSNPAHCHPFTGGWSAIGNETRGLRADFSLLSLPPHVSFMNLFEPTRALVDIESITNNEERASNYLYDYLAPLAALYDGQVERIDRKS